MTNEILVVDDNSDIRLLICGILKDKGFSVREAANFDQAINEINRKIINCQPLKIQVLIVNDSIEFQIHSSNNRVFPIR